LTPLGGTPEESERLHHEACEVELEKVTLQTWAVAFDISLNVIACVHEESNGIGSCVAVGYAVLAAPGSPLVNTVVIDGNIYIVMCAPIVIGVFHERDGERIEPCAGSNKRTPSVHPTTSEVGVGGLIP
jgi:hypothetical protein